MLHFDRLREVHDGLRRLALAGARIVGGEGAFSVATSPSECLFSSHASGEAANATAALCVFSKDSVMAVNGAFLAVEAGAAYIAPALAFAEDGIITA